MTMSTPCLQKNLPYLYVDALSIVCVIQMPYRKEFRQPSNAQTGKRLLRWVVIKLLSHLSQ